jgi:hypothetical protein
VEVADVAAQADVLAEEHHQPASDIPSELILVAADAHTLDRGPDQPEARQAVWLDRSDFRRQHEVAHQGQHVRCLTDALAEEILGVPELFFEADDAAEGADGAAIVHAFVVAVRDLGAPRVAAEVVTDEGADESLRQRRPAACEQEECGAKRGQ